MRDRACCALEDMQRTHNKMSFMVDMLEHAAHYMHVPDLTHIARRVAYQS